MLEEERFAFRSDVDLTSLCLEGERIRLRSIHPRYAPAIFQEFTEEIALLMLPKPADDIEETLIFISTSIEGMQGGWDLALAILVQENEEFLGCCGLHGRGNPLTPELGIWLKKSAHGNKYGREAIGVLCGWALKNLIFDYLVYPADRKNVPSRKIPESMGGTVCEERKAPTMRGGFLDEVVYHLSKDQLVHHQARERPAPP